MTFIISCPHCCQDIEILEINCRIFRCGVYKENHQQIGQHLPKEICDKLVIDDKIYGCGKPFILIQNNEVDNKNEDLSVSSKWKPQICDYI